MRLNEAKEILSSNGYSIHKSLPTIICADMGVGKTTFIEKINKINPGSGYDLEVADIPGIWSEPNSEGMMYPVTGWENIALDKLKSLDVDYIAITSDQKMVNLLLNENISFFLAYKDNVNAIRVSIENRTKTHFKNVINDFKEYIEDSNIPESLKKKMLSCDDSALYDYRCTEAIPEDIINTDKFQNDDRYRHWHDMFILPSANVSIMENNINGLKKKLKFYDSINNPLCHKIKLDDKEFLSSPRIFNMIIS
jgi:hypothetical protein